MFQIIGTEDPFALESAAEGASIKSATLLPGATSALGGQNEPLVPTVPSVTEVKAEISKILSFVTQVHVDWREDEEASLTVFDATL